MAEITSAGFIAKTQNEYFEQEQSLYFAIDAAWNTDPSSPDGLKIASDSEMYGNLDEQIQLAYNSKDPNKTRGVELDVVSALTGTFRSTGTPSQSIGAVEGVVGTVVTAGSIVTQADGTEWTIDNDIIITAGTDSVGVTCAVDGATPASIGSISTIKTSIGGWQSFSNTSVATLGTDTETDSSLRIKRQRSVARPGSNQLDSMTGEIFAVDGVRGVRIYENDTNSAAVDPIENPYGLPAHSISPVVDGGTDEDVALAIYIKKNPGVLLNQAGTPVSVIVQSPSYEWQLKTINFSRPIYKDVVVEVTVVDDGTLPGTAANEITQAIIDYTQGTLIDPSCGFNPNGFDIGDDVAISRIYTPVNSVIGSYGQSYVSVMLLDSAGTNVTIDFNERSRFSDSNITVTIA